MWKLHDGVMRMAIISTTSMGANDGFKFSLQALRADQWSCRWWAMTFLPDNFGRRIGSLDDLPAKLRDQLQLGKVADLDQAIINLIRDDLEGIANLDEVLVGLFRRRGEVFERHFVSNKLYRMNKAGLIRSVVGKKGVYETIT